MKALKILLYVVLGLLALWALLGLFARKNYHIERSTEIDAPIELVHEQVSFFKNFKHWSPWHVYDPNMQTNIEGTDGTPGAVYTWSGNDKVGKGNQVLRVVTPTRVELDVSYNDWGPSPVFFQLEPKGQKTNITWAMDMHVPFPWNAFAMLTDVNAFVGKDYESGLINLKKVCEDIAHKIYRGFEVFEVDLPVRYYVSVRKVVPIPEITSFFGENLGMIMEMVQSRKLTQAGPPSGLYWSYDEEAGTTDMAAAIPIAEEKKLGSGVQVFTVGGGKALVIDYLGDYTGLGEAHRAMDDCMQDMKLRNIPPAVEEYLTDPSTEPDTAKWLTKIIYFVEPEEK